VDLDSDGKGDILSGSWPGELYFFRGMGKGLFSAGEKIKDKDGKEIKLGSASTVFAADFNGDGLPDLLVGCIEGHVWLVPNEGTAGKPAFGKARKLQAGGQDIQVPHGDSHPVVADWDGDGIPDLIVGTGAGSVLFYRNVGSAKEPTLAAAQTLVAESKFGHGGNPPKADAKDCCGMRAKVCVVDYNGDGALDLLVGDFSSVQGSAPELTAKEKEAVAKAREGYDKLFQKYRALFEEQQKLNNPSDKETSAAQAEREKKLKEIQEKLQPFQEEAQKLYPVMAKGQPKWEYRGHVWLYLRKPGKAAALKP
jgi:hypothetical protein